jgi:hypothetical protein
VTAEAQEAPAGGKARTEVARGVARVGPGPAPSRMHRARGVATVPGALSVPRPAPPVLRPLPLAVLLAERPDPPPEPAAPADTKVEEPPELRTAVPTEADETVIAVGDGALRVREKGFLKRLGRRAALPAACAAVAAFVVGTTYVALADQALPPDDDLGRWAASAMVTMPPAIEGAGNAGRPPGDPFGNIALSGRGAPTRVRVSAIGLDSPLELLHLGANAALQPPKRFERAGWYMDGSAPGDIGPAVIAGHVDSKAGPAVFYRLRELTAGDKIEVVRGGIVLRFTVTRTAWYPKNKFPTTQVYGPTPDRQLRLITCGGVFDHRLRSYKDNLVVYAVAG